MALTHAERQKAYRERQSHVTESRTVTRDVTLGILLELKEEIAALRDEIVTLRDDLSLDGSLKRKGSTPPKENTPSLIPNLIRSLDHEFVEIYEIYPRHIARPEAVKAYRTARKQASFDVILGAVRKFAIECQTTEKKFIPYPATWFNKGRWTDEEPQSNGHDTNAPCLPFATGPKQPITDWEVDQILGRNRET